MANFKKCFKASYAVLTVGATYISSLWLQIKNKVETVQSATNQILKSYTITKIF